MIKKKGLLSLLLGGALVGALWGSSVAGQDVSAGKATFDSKCASCHGPGGSGGMGPALNAHEHEADEIRNVIRNGGGGMPAFDAAAVSEAQLADLVAYVQSLARSGTTAPSTTQLPRTGDYSLAAVAAMALVAGFVLLTGGLALKRLFRGTQ